jgi:imidazolonepropionase-like amidohydrolase
VTQKPPRVGCLLAHEGLDDVGLVERGRRADLVVLATDPSQRIEAVRDIVLVLQGGIEVFRASGR